MTLTLSCPESEIFIPDGSAPELALCRTSHLAIGAHPDDLEIFAVGAIMECFEHEDRWFTGVVVTDGAGSPRHGRYRAYTDERMRQVRRLEQKKAASVGSYSAQLLLDHPSQAVKGGARAVIDDLKAVLGVTRPKLVFTHGLTDKHDTHVAVALRVIQACRELSEDACPERLLGCEVWRDLDWLVDSDKVEFQLGDEHLQHALLGVYDSQIAGGKRYDLAALGRRRAHATFAQTHGLDDALGRLYAMDLTPLLRDRRLDPARYARQLIERFGAEVDRRIERLSQN